ncbi:MAG: hypothetical protein QM723_14740 [Myxococcaceae bacterium]
MDRRTALKAWLAMVALLAAGAFGSWVLQSTLARAAPLEAADFSEGMARLELLLNALPAIARHSDAVLVVGSSPTQHGFSPERYQQALEARGVRAAAFNLGIPGGDPQVERALSERLAREYAGAGTRAKLVLLEVTPYQLTRAYSSDSKNRELDDLKLSALGSPQVLSRLPVGEAAHVVAIEAQGRRSAFVSAALVGTLAVDRSPAWWPFAREIDPLAERKRLAGVMRAAVHQPEWDPVTHGESRYFTPETAAVYAQWRALKTTETTMRAELGWRVANADILERRFDPARVEELYATIAALETFADKVQLWVAPTNPRYITPTAQGLARQKVLFDALAAGGHPVVDLEAEHGFIAEDFIDTTHLEEEIGRPKLSDRLAAF